MVERFWNDVPDKFRTILVPVVNAVSLMKETAPGGLVLLTVAPKKPLAPRPE